MKYMILLAEEIVIDQKMGYKCVIMLVTYIYMCKC